MNWVKQIAIILLASAAMLLPAFFNGFPLLYSDTGAYIASGFEGSVPGDRPITYGLFLRHASLAHSLWFVIIAQAIILSALLFVIAKKRIGNVSHFYAWFLFIVFGLSLVSSLPWISSMLLADVFTPISFLLLYILLFQTPSQKSLQILLAILYLYSASTHLTHLPTHLAMMVGIGFFKALKFQILSKLSWLKWSVLLLLVSANLLCIPAIHYAHKGGFVISKNGHLFITARFIESGAVTAYLQDHCANEDFFLCAYKDSLPNNGSDFLWLPESVLYKTGGWNEHREEYKALNKAIWLSPSYLSHYIHHLKRVMWFHLSAHHVGEELIPLGLNSPPGWEAEAHFKEELPQLLGAKQAQHYWQGKFSYINSILFYVFLFACLLLLIFFFHKAVSAGNKLFILCLFLMYVGNFISVCIASSGSRYNARVDWLFVFAAMVVFLSFYRIQNPESRIQSPESRIQSLESRV